mmetsp:Transcript_10934/g.33526  ORF Transcript_10934/g.33526 Transcript_10934/m.33526 type:complete len:395 (+) Transcript_10934:184-1368(+)|eukprot:CAMPEP_0198731600 /NCGR_PEP_ID=MMETSP1475-20131203/30858_1 /TAXON_ID= ORGANISM="Unidentified sp., Strain CCMP1999" /NCGR_SAMPLE_ID=MMETSP1475 /ASSEMBLY_ACC=CAM_ASM_001111 /LENGTH=394 /DNA_ID=CAMNT_0044494583 /DNA_START=84 /DNA_END=1268 /DNA_ORIENTATION=-
MDPASAPTDVYVRVVSYDPVVGSLVLDEDFAECLLSKRVYETVPQALVPRQLRVRSELRPSDRLDLVGVLANFCSPVRVDLHGRTNGIAVGVLASDTPLPTTQILAYDAGEGVASSEPGGDFDIADDYIERQTVFEDRYRDEQVIDLLDSRRIFDPIPTQVWLTAQVRALRRYESRSDNPSLVKRLPDEVLAKIATFLSFTDLVRLSHTCRYMRSRLQSAAPLQLHRVIARLESSEEAPYVESARCSLFCHAVHVSYTCVMVKRLIESGWVPRETAAVFDNVTVCTLRDVHVELYTRRACHLEVAKFPHVKTWWCLSGSTDTIAPEHQVFAKLETLKLELVPELMTNGILQALLRLCPALKSLQVFGDRRHAEEFAAECDAEILGQVELSIEAT